MLQWKNQVTCRWKQLCSHCHTCILLPKVEYMAVLWVCTAAVCSRQYMLYAEKECLQIPPPQHANACCGCQRPGCCEVFMWENLNASCCYKWINWLSLGSCHWQTKHLFIVCEEFNTQQYRKEQLKILCHVITIPQRTISDALPCI